MDAVKKGQKHPSLHVELDAKATYFEDLTETLTSANIPLENFSIVKLKNFLKKLHM